MKRELPQRKNNRLKEYDYSSSGVYFITVCTKDKAPIFWAGNKLVNKADAENIVGEDSILPSQKGHLSPAGKIVAEVVEKIPEYYSNMELLQYVIMPNHIHLLLWIDGCGGRILSSPTKAADERGKTISTVIGQTKRLISKRLGFPVWQRSFHDHIVRNDEDYQQIARYIQENPLKWELDCFYTKQ